MEEFEESPIDSEAGKKPRSAKWIKSDSAVRAADLLAGAIAIAVVFSSLQYSTTAICCGVFDCYSHIKWSRLFCVNMRAGHFPSSFSYLLLTILILVYFVYH